MRLKTQLVLAITGMIVALVARKRQVQRARQIRIVRHILRAGAQECHRIRLRRRRPCHISIVGRSSDNDILAAAALKRILAAAADEAIIAVAAVQGIDAYRANPNRKKIA